LIDIGSVTDYIGMEHVWLSDDWC